MAKPYLIRTVLGAFLFVVTLATFYPATENNFVETWDDSLYAENSRIAEGLTVEAVAWAMRTGEGGAWLPLTWLSHALDVELYGKDPWGHHLSSVLLHSINAVLVFVAMLALFRPAETDFRLEALCALVAVLFAIHPLRVESVAWVSERKDLLSACWFFVSLIAYAYYAQCSRRPRRWAYYALAQVGLIFSVASKQTMVTAAFVFLLLDCWPLCRLRPESAKAFPSWKTLRPLLIEKLPFLAIGLAASAMVLRTQAQGGYTSSFELVPLEMRVATALMASGSYLALFIAPLSLSNFYPHPTVLYTTREIWLWAGAAATVHAVLFWQAFRHAERFPYLLIGLLWYWITVMPVLGLVTIGLQGSADRYTYVPSIGLSLAVVWRFGELAASFYGRGSTRSLLAGKVGAVFLLLGLILMAVQTRSQIRVWHDDEVLWQHALALEARNQMAYSSLAKLRFKQGKYAEALTLVQKAHALTPEDSFIALDLGLAHGRLGDFRSAEPHLRAALLNLPNDSRLHRGLSAVEAQKGNLKAAIYHADRAASLDPAGPRNPRYLRLLRRELKEQRLREKAGESSP